LLRALLNAGKKQATDLLNTSKKNEARELYSVRVKNSARCPIVPSTTLKVDEIGIPRHLAYEMCREGFIAHLCKELNFTKEEAIKSTREEYNNPELQRLFNEYVEKQVVLLY
jgi:DNA-directed RNA polymerase beta' subunit